jgi:hypothetical protein
MESEKENDMSKQTTKPAGMGSKALHASADLIISVDGIGGDGGKCFSCGCKLDEEAIEAGREQCFECYLVDQD